MNWYRGDISQAVAESRQKNAIFVVYVAGKDSNTERMTSLLNNDKIRSQLESENFVAIRIESDSQSYMQFASIYQMVPVPSIFFIGKSGVPIEIGTSMLQSSDELDEKIQSVLSSEGMSSSGSVSSSFIEAEKLAVNEEPPAPIETVGAEVTITDSQKEEDQLSSKNVESAVTTASEAPGPAPAPVVNENPKNDESEVVCENGVCYKKPKEVTPTVEGIEEKDQTNTEQNEGDDSADLNARLELTRKLLEQKRRERVEEEKLQEKERELRRRRDGKEMQHLQEWQREQELKDMKESIRRERLEEQTARERIRAQIAADRAERAHKFASLTVDGEASTSKDQSANIPIQNASVRSDAAVRLQFRLPNGNASTNTFEPSTTVALLRDYVSGTLLAGTGVNEFVLATAYPKYEFTPEDNPKTLFEMGLAPSAVILVIYKASSKPTDIIARSGLMNIMNTLFWAMMTPLFSVFSYLRTMMSGKNNGRPDGGQKRANEDSATNQDASKRRNLDLFMTAPSTSKEPNEVQSGDRNEQTAEQKPYRRYGSTNVHRLNDKRKDSDDENATWNGNSTQQQ